MVTSTNPILPLDIKEVTWLVKPPTGLMTDEALIGFCAQALAKHKIHIDKMQKCIDMQKYEQLVKYEQDNTSVIKDYHFNPGSLVLVQNTSVESSLDKKLKSRYTRPMIVIRCTCGGSYIVAEMNGAVLQSKIAMFRVVPYYAQEHIAIPGSVMDLTDVSKDILQKIIDQAEAEEETKQKDLALDHVKLVPSKTHEIRVELLKPMTLVKTTPESTGEPLD